MVGIPMLLVLKQPDLGTALTYLPVLIMALFLGGLRPNTHRHLFCWRRWFFRRSGITGSSPIRSSAWSASASRNPIPRVPGTKSSNP